MLLDTWQLTSTSLFLLTRNCLSKQYNFVVAGKFIIRISWGYTIAITIFPNEQTFHFNTCILYTNAFFRYKEGSIKQSTRGGREKGVSRTYTLRSITRLPQQKAVLTVTTNKAQLIDLICEDVVSHKNDFMPNKLVVTGRDPLPVEINHGVVIRRQDMRITHEEADTLIVQQVASVQSQKALVVADDTDIFVLLLHFCYHGDINSQVMMVSPIQDRTLIDITATVNKHKMIMPELLAVHGLSGCDTVAPCYGIGKGVALKVLRSKAHSLGTLGDGNAALKDVVSEATKFMLACYGQSQSQTMTEARQRMWRSKVGRSMAGAPKLATLPPTDEAFAGNVARAHLQVAIWRHALDAEPPSMEPTAYGWERDATNSLVPTTVPEGVLLAPVELLKLIKCSCESSMPCKTNRCGCSNSNMACTVFCSCQGSEECFNAITRQLNQTDNTDDDDDDDDD